MQSIGNYDYWLIKGHPHLPAVNLPMSSHPRPTTDLLAAIRAGHLLTGGRRFGRQRILDFLQELDRTVKSIDVALVNRTFRLEHFEVVHDDRIHHAKPRRNQQGFVE